MTEPKQDNTLTGPCSHCGGRGVVRGDHVHFISGFGYTNMTTCPWCGGSGQEVDVASDVKSELSEPFSF